MDDNFVGERIRELRRLQGVSTRELAARAGISAGYVSQIENGQANVSMRVVRSIAQAFGIQWLELFDTTPVHGKVLRREDRPRLSTGSAVRHYGITQPPVGNVEVIVSEYEPGEGAGDEDYTHGDSQEICIVLHGILHFRLGDQDFELREGDSIEYRTSTPHMLTNIGDDVAEALWVVSPPSDFDWMARGGSESSPDSRDGASSERD